MHCEAMGGADTGLGPLLFFNGPLHHKDMHCLAPQRTLPCDGMS